MRRDRSSLWYKSIALLFVLILAVPILAACGEQGSTQTPTPSFTPTQAPSSTPYNGVTVTIEPTNSATSTPQTPTSTPESTLTSTPTSIPTAQAGQDSVNLIYEDDFSNPQSGWFVDTNADRSYSYNNGEYDISVNKSGMIYSSSNNAVGQQTNFVVEVDARIISPSKDVEYGIKFRRTKDNDFYYFDIKDNHFEIYKYINGQWDSLQRSTKSNYIRTDGTINNLKVYCLGKTIEVYVNGQILATVSDELLNTGEILLMVGGAGATVAFDNFKLYHFSAAYIVNTDPSIPVITTTEMASGEVGVKYVQYLAVSGGTSPYTFSVIDGTLPDGLSLTTSNGLITGMPDMEGKFDFTLQVSCSTGMTTAPVSITVTSLAISTAHLPDGNLHEAYNYALAVSGGLPPYTWSLGSGSLPGGLTLNASTGLIAGVPTKAGGPVTIFCNVTDSAGAVQTKGLSISIKLGNFQVIDDWAFNAPDSVGTSISNLVAYLIKPNQSDTEKARVIYSWIADNIAYDVPSGKKIDAGINTGIPDQDAEAVFSRRNGVCEGYSNLFKKMAGYAGLQAQFIRGWGKVDYSYLEAKSFKKDHAWNAVKIDGEWKLIDSTWGAGYEDDKDNFVKEFDDFWFLTPPEQFIYTHCPDDSEWQLLQQPFSSAAIAQHPLVKAPFFQYGLQLGNNDYPYYSVGNSLFISIPTPPDVVLTASVFQNDQKLDGNYTFYQRDEANYEVYAVFPGAGDYELLIYAKWISESGDYHGAIKYRIVSTQNMGSMTEYPTVYSDFTDRGAYLYSRIPGQPQAGTYYNFSISVPGAQKVAFITNADSASPVFQNLTRSGQVFEGLIGIVQGQMKISAQFPGENTYWGLLGYTGR